MKWFSFFLLPFLFSSCAQALENDLSPADSKEVMEAYQDENFDLVIEKTTDLAPNSPWKRVRATALQRRGEAHFFKAEIEAAIADFDAFIELFPEQDPYHWQRGLAYYYAGEFEKGKAQFERHQAVNSQDVENAVWHFLCSVRAPGGDLEAARKNLIPIDQDSRIPMKEVHDLFAGRGTVEDVLAAAKENDIQVLSEEERNHLCYAHLYLGLYFEAIGENEKSALHIEQAAFVFPMNHYMGKTAQVHAKLRGIKASKP